QLNDSKKLSVRQRNLIRPLIEEKAMTFGVAHLHPESIDEINILNASIQAMHEALSVLKQNPQKILVDGNRFKPFGSIPYECVIKGDGKYLSIAAASVLAKTYRDAYMELIHEEYPMYNWKKNKGYPTVEHREAIKKYGITPYHRKSFRLLPRQLKFEL
ncbi:MAG: ribonuclease HII, partial [Flavobacteriaceae bacterium]|nr:ribonuclease HII [Flavobacteriaceae bacterium]